MKLYHRATLLIAALAVSLTAAAQPEFPTKPITLVVAYPVGGGTDILARLIADKLTPRLGQPVIVMNRPGATGIIGGNYVERAKPDGYTLLLTPGSFPYVQMVLESDPNNGYDPLNGFTAVAQVADVPIYLAASGQSKYTTAQQVIEAAKTTKVSYATAGIGSIHHMVGEVVNDATGVKMEQVPYQGVTPAINDLLGGHIDLAYTSPDPILPYANTDRVRVLATSAAERRPFYPDVPTFRELGYDIDVGTWYGIFGPKGVPTDIVQLLNEHINAILVMPDVVERIATLLGATPVQGPPELLEKLNAEDSDRFGEIIKRLNIKAQ